ncbi:nitroreductase/quinone reductase family protein [Streptomyces sp. NPDC051018]|uniref:nitroreductase/quinone reductase family protein n=1 Tax=Streptomyces sp. NPDC051018 TaxID=3365639 RepID=UPI0037ACA999
MPNDFNQRIIDEFRANGGTVGGPFEGTRLLLLTTTGIRSKARYTTPLGRLPDGDRVLVIASAGGAPRHPAWYHNLRAEPRVTVEDGVFVYDARAVVLEGKERDDAFARAVEFDAGLGEYQSRTTRVIPVVALEEIAEGPPTIPGATTFGAYLTRIHGALRREVALIREEIAASASGAAASGSAVSGSGRTATALGAQLRVNCLTLCEGLRHHHQGEDSSVFPMIRERFPEHAPVLARLDSEHRKVAAILDELQRIVTSGAGPLAVLPEVDRLAAELDVHLAYEEEQLIPLMDA